MPKARWVVKTAWRIGRLAHVRGRWLQGLRNAAMRWTPGRVNARQIDHLYALNY